MRTMRTRSQRRATTRTLASLRDDDLVAIFVRVPYASHDALRVCCRAFGRLADKRALARHRASAGWREEAIVVAGGSNDTYLVRCRVVSSISDGMTPLCAEVCSTRVEAHAPRRSLGARRGNASLSLRFPRRASHPMFFRRFLGARRVKRRRARATGTRGRTTRRRGLLSAAGGAPWPGSRRPVVMRRSQNGGA